MALGDAFGRGFAQGQSIFSGMQKQFEDAEQRRELAKIAEAKPETSTGYTADTGAELEKLAGQGYKVDFDQAKNAYVATNDAGDTKSFAMQGITDFMGKRTAGTMSQAQVDNSKMLAMADVIGKSDPMAALRMKREVREGDHQAARQAREQKSWAKEDAVEALDTKLGQDFDASLVGEDGKKRAPTADDYMKANQQRAYAYAAAGHMKEAQSAFKENLASAYTKIQMDGAERKQALGPAMAALSSGDYGAVADFYNRFVPSGAKVTGIEAGKDGGLVMQRTGIDGQPMSPLLAKDKREAMAMLQSLENPSALYQYSQDEFSNQLKLKQDARADHADKRADAQLELSRRADARAGAAAGRAASNDSRERSEKQQRADARVQLALEQNPKLSDAQKNAIRYGVMDLPGQADKGEKHTYNPVEIQKSFGEVVSDPYSGKESIKRNGPKEQKFIDWWADNPQFKSQDRALQEFNRVDSKQRRAGEATKQQPPKIASKAEFEKLASGSHYTDPNGAVRVKP